MRLTADRCLSLAKVFERRTNDPRAQRLAESLRYLAGVRRQQEEEEKEKEKARRQTADIPSPEFDADRYARILPLLRAAAAEFPELHDNKSALVSRMVVHMRNKLDLSREAMEAIRPYMRKWYNNLAAGVETLKDGAAVVPYGPDDAEIRALKTQVGSARSAEASHMIETPAALAPKAIWESHLADLKAIRPATPQTSVAISHAKKVLAEK